MEASESPTAVVAGQAGSLLTSSRGGMVGERVGEFDPEPLKMRPHLPCGVSVKFVGMIHASHGEGGGRLCSSGRTPIFERAAWAVTYRNWWTP